MLKRYYIDLRENTQEEKQEIHDKIDGWAWTMAIDHQTGVGLVGLDFTWQGEGFEDFLRSSGLDSKVRYKEL